MSPQLTDADIAKHDASVGKVLTDADIAARDSNPQGYLSQVGTGLWNTVKGLAQVGVETGGVVFDPLNAIEHLKKLKQMVVDPQVDQAIKAADKWKSGDHSEAVGHALAAVLPGVGPAAANIGEKLGNQDYTGAAADATVLGATMVAPKVAGAIVDAAPVLKGAAKGGYAAATETIPLTRHGVDINVPKPLATGAAAGAAARMAGLPATPAAIIGGVAPIVRGMVRGAREAMGPREFPPSWTESPVFAGEGFPQSAPAAVAPVVETPGMILARESGQDWAKLSAADRGMLETVAKAQANATAQPAARPPMGPPAAPPAPARSPLFPVPDITPPRSPLFPVPDIPPESGPPAAAAPEPAPSSPPAGGKPAAADIAQQLEASSRPDRMLDFLRRMDPAFSQKALDSLAPHEWQMVAEGAGSPRGTAPTAEDIQAIRGNLAQYEGASQITAKTPAAAVAEFEQKRAVRTKRKTAPPVVDVEGQLAESLAKVEKGERPVAQVPPEQPRAATASDKRVEAYAQHFAADPGTAIADIEPLTKLPEFPKLGRALEIEGSLAPGEAERIAARVKELRGEAAAAPPAIIKPDVESTPTLGQTTGEQSGSAGQAVSGSRKPTNPVARGSATSVRVPGERTAYEGQYSVRELDDIHASHNAHTFEKNPNYQLRNDRDYSNPVNKERIVVNSKGDTFDPAYVLADSPDATNGAPVIDADGNVLGGNSRAMILDRVYKNNPEGAAAYRAELARRASQFGIDPEQLAGMKRPVLVRQLSDAGLNPQRAITDLNKTGTAALTTAERATADARRITPAAADYLATAIDTEGADATLNDVLSGKGGLAIVNRLVDDGVFTMQERPNLIDTKTGAVTAAAKERISKLLLGQVFEDADQMTRTPAEVRNKLERTVSPILQSGQKAGFDIRPAVRQALDVLEYARAHGITRMNDLLAQESMFEDAPKFSAQAADLAQFIQDSKPTAIAKAFRRYLANAEPTMFGKSTPAEAFADAFGVEQPPATLRELMQPKPTPREKIPGTSAVAERLVNAQNSLVENIMERAGLGREDAARAADVLLKRKLAKLDPIMGSFELTHGGAWDVDVLRRAAEEPPAAAAPRKRRSKPIR
jgi:hypothetical protein